MRINRHQLRTTAKLSVPDRFEGIHSDGYIDRLQSRFPVGDPIAGRFQTDTMRAHFFHALGSRQHDCTR